MAVRLFGRPVEWEALQTAVPQEVVLLEDAAGALGAQYRGTPCGALGVAACLSFHPRKIVTTGEGGAVTTDEAALDGAVRRLRHHGWATLGGHALSGIQLPTSGSSLRRRDPAAGAARGAAGGSRAGGGLVRGAARAPRADTEGQRRVTVTAGRPTSSSSIGATTRSRRFATPRHRSADRARGAIHHLEPYRAQGANPGADRAFERALALPFATTTTEAEVEACRGRVLDRRL